ncbi:MAG: hypothetical protein JWP37_413 [Mucilaginibacter sp.]|nr:hypothetical protein [Mucilaginibacter sp.]
MFGKSRLFFQIIGRFFLLSLRPKSPTQPIQGGRALIKEILKSLRQGEIIHDVFALMMFMRAAPFRGAKNYNYGFTMRDSRFAKCREINTF